MLMILQSVLMCVLDVSHAFLIEVYVMKTEVLIWFLENSESQLNSEFREFS